MPSASLQEVTEALDGYLRIAEIQDEPGALNGLQAENRSGRISRIIAAVDASLATIESVRAEHPDDHPLLLAHHGLFWDGPAALTGRRFRRVRALLERDLAVYSAHIPLDVHPEVGNNAVLARQLGLSALAPFDSYRGIALGVQGLLEPGLPREEFVARIEGVLGARVTLLPGGPSRSHRVGVITGRAGGRIAAARDAGLDTFLTGEGSHHNYFDAMELGVNVVFGGHYATETVGVRALAAYLGDRFALPWEFHDHPTGL